MAQILVVEDSPTQAEKLRATLEAGGYDSMVARSAEQALEMIANSAFDMVVSDVVMPGRSGYDLCRRLKDNPQTKSIPVVLLTTLRGPLDIMRGLEAGADNFLTKPYETEHLIQRITTLLENRRLRHQRRFSTDVEILFLGNRFTITSDHEQIIDQLIASFEDIIRTNQELEEHRKELSAANATIERYARQLEGKVQVTEEKFRVLFETANDAILVIDLDSGGIIDANPAAAELFGREVARLLESDIYSLLPDDPILGDPTAIREWLSEGGEYLRDRQIDRGDDERVIVEISASAISLDGRQLVNAILRDVTENKRAEEQLLQAQKMEAVGQLTGGIAHDFNNLLTIIGGNLQLLEHASNDDPRHAKFIDAASRAARRGADLTSRLLGFARKQVLEPKVVDANELIGKLDQMLRRTIGEDVEIRTTLGDGLWPSRADPAQLENAILNLVVNARDAMPGGGKLTIETYNVSLDADYAARHSEVTPGDYVMLAVSDTGSGIPADVLDRIFEPFFTTKPTGKGTGLGLSMVFGFVKQSQGHIKAYSEVGHGTSIKIYLPRIIAGDADAGPAARDADTSSGGDETILLVEDDTDVADVAVALLEDLGYSVLQATNGPDALKVFDAHDDIDLLLTDVVMPGGMDGVELARRMKALRPELKVLFSSGYTQNALSHGGILDKGVHVVAKPYHRDGLAQKVREAIDRE